MADDSGKIIDFFKAAGLEEVMAAECSCGHREFVLTQDHRVYCPNCRRFLDARWQPGATVRDAP